MAAITYWVDPVSGTTGATGLAFSAAVQTIDNVIARIVSAGNGNDFTVNLVNTGDHIQTNQNRQQIDNFTTATFLIRGTDENGSPAVATIKPENTGTTTSSKSAFFIRENAGVTFEHIRWDARSVSAGTGNISFLTIRDSEPSDLVTLRYMEFLGAELNEAPAGQRNIVVDDTTSDSNKGSHVVEYSYMQNLQQPFATNVAKTVVHDCVIVQDGLTVPMIVSQLSTAASSTAEFYNNTVYAVDNNISSLSSISNGVFRVTAQVTYEKLFLYNNLVFFNVREDTTIESSDFTTSGVFTSIQPSTATVTSADVRFNIVVFGQKLSQIDTGSTFSQYYGDDFWDAPYSGDSITRNRTTDSVFVDVDTSYQWTPAGSPIALTINRDLRPIDFTASGVDGGIPGALEAGDLTGIITVTVSPETASWTITSSTATYTGIGSTTLAAVFAGDYTITWHPVENYRTPSPASVSGTLVAQETLAFSVEYQLSTVAFLYADVSSPSLAITNDTVLAKFDLDTSTRWFDYEFVVWSGTDVVSVHSILAVTSTTAATMFQVTGEPDITTPGLLYAVSPTRSAKENFFSKYPYERALVEGAPGRTNVWPAHSAITDLLLFEGAEYQTFVDTELARGLSADTVGASPPTNVLWRKLTPNGIKSLDNDDEILQKLVLVFGMSFDKIRLYQEQLSYAHTIGYQDYNHVPRTLVTELAKLWGWTLSHDTKNNSLTSYNLAVYDHYATGMTDAVGNLSAADINFERWRRVVSSLVRIWKAKGTRKAIELVLDAYGIPSDLLVVKEYVYFIDRALQQPNQLREIPTGVFVTTGSTQTRVWVDPDDGSAQVISNKPIYNIRLLDIGVAETEAIVNDVFSWASTTDLSFVDVNGTAIELSGYTGSKYDFEQHLINLFIPSDGSSRTASNYPLLEAVYSSYLSNSVNAYTYGDFDSFIQFIEENFNEIVKQLVPASSRLNAQGNIIQNLPFHRQKFVWQEEGDVAQPFNGEKQWVFPLLAGNKQTNVAATVDAVVTSAAKLANVQSNDINVSTVVAGKETAVSTEVANVSLQSAFARAYETDLRTVQAVAEKLNQPAALYELSSDTVGVVFDITAPSIVSYSADSGSPVFTAFSPSALIVTNDNTFNLFLSANNMSVSGSNRIIAELFRRLDADDIEQISSSAFTVQQTVYEGSPFAPRSGQFGTYKLSSINGLAVGDILRVESQLSAYVNTAVSIVNIYTGSNKITTSPPIGLDNLPVGKNAARIGLRTLFSSEVVVYLIRALEEIRIPHDTVMDAINYLYAQQPPVELRTSADFKGFERFITDLSVQTGIRRQTLFGAFEPFYSFTTAELAGSAIVVPFLRDNPDFELSADRVYISDVLINRIANVTLRKANEFFDWASPVLTREVNQSSQGNFVTWPADSNLVGITTANTRTLSGRFQIGGLDDLNAPILQDKQEYFIRWKADAEVPSPYTGETYFDVYNGRNVVSSSYGLQIINNIYYYGNYFVYMKTSKEPVFELVPPTYNSTETGRTETASVELQFRGVGDSDRLELQFLFDGPAPQYDAPTGGPGQLTASYTSFTTGHWATATTITIPVKPNADDRTLYTVQTTLEPNSWYWWRVRNSKQKLSMFGYVLQSVTHSEPKLFFTGDFKDTDAEEGINPDTPEPPTNPTNPDTTSGPKKPTLNIG